MTISTRAGKGSALTHAELDANFTDLGLAHGDTTIALSVDQVTVTGNVASKITTVGDFDYGIYAATGFNVAGGDQSWAMITLKENSGSTGKPVQGLANASIIAEISGGTVASPTALEAGKRLISLIGSGTLDASGTLPTFAQSAIVLETTEAQTTAACGGKMTFETSPNGRAETTTRTQTLSLQDNVVTINPNGNGTITTGGNLTLSDDVDVTGTFNVDGATTLDGNTTLGNATTDVVNVKGQMSFEASSGGLTIPVLDSASAAYLDSAAIAQKGSMAIVTDGSRANVPMFYDGADWRYFSDSAVIS